MSPTPCLLYTSVSSAIEDTLSSGGMLNYNPIALSLGEYAAPMGTGAALVLLAPQPEKGGDRGERKAFCGTDRTAGETKETGNI